MQKNNFSSSSSDPVTCLDEFKQLISDNRVIMFSKSSCPFCDNLKLLFESHMMYPEDCEGYQIVELDELENGKAL